MIIEECAKVDPSVLQPKENDNSSEKLILEWFKNLGKLREIIIEHGDIKPGNIMVSKKNDRKIKFIDLDGTAQTIGFSREGDDILAFARSILSWRFDKILKPLSRFNTRIKSLHRFIYRKPVHYKDDYTPKEESFPNNFSDDEEIVSSKSKTKIFGDIGYWDMKHLKDEDKKLAFFILELLPKRNSIISMNLIKEKFLYEELLIDPSPSKELVDLLTKKTELTNEEFLKTYYLPWFDILKKTYNFDDEDPSFWESMDKKKELVKEKMKANIKDFWSKGLPLLLEKYCGYKVTEVDKVLLKAADYNNHLTLEQVIHDLEEVLKNINKA